MKRCKTGWLLVNQIRSQLLNSTAQQLMIIISVVFLWVIANLLRTKSSQNDRIELKSSPPLTIRVMHKIYIKMPNYLWLLSQPQYRALLLPFRGAIQITCPRCFNADCNIMQQPAKERSQLQTSLVVDLEQKTPLLDALNDAYLATCEHVRKETSSGAEEEHIATDCWWGWQSVVSHVLLLLLHKITSRHSSCSINLADKSRIRVGRFSSRNHRRRRWCITNSTLYVTGRKLNAFAEAERRRRRCGSRCVLKTTKRDSVQWNAPPKANPAQMES